MSLARSERAFAAPPSPFVPEPFRSSPCRAKLAGPWARPALAADARRHPPPPGGRPCCRAYRGPVRPGIPRWRFRMKYPERLAAFALATLMLSACDGAPLPPTAADIAPSLGKAGSFKNFRIPTDNSQPRQIVLGSDGAMWFTESEFNVSQIGRIDLQGNITEFVVPTQFS